MHSLFVKEVGSVTIFYKYIFSFLAIIRITYNMWKYTNKSAVFQNDLRSTFLNLKNTIVKEEVMLVPSDKEIFYFMGTHE